ncbi:MAG: AMP-binding protein [Chthoniobacterales bacterium]
MSRQTHPLNPAQKWLIAGGATPFRSLTQVSLSFGEAMDKERLRSAWTAIFQAHPSLRVQFSGGSQLVQSITDTMELPWTDLDWSAVSPSEIGAKWFELLKSDRERPFTESDAVLCRFSCLTLPNGSHHLLWTFSELIADRESILLIARELLKRYDSEEHSEEEDDAWKQFAEWSSTSGTIKDAVTQALAAGTTGISLANTSGGENNAPWEQTHLLNPDLMQTMQNCADRLQVPVASILEGAWAMVLARLTGREDVVYTRQHNARGLVVRHDAVGCFSAALPTFTRLDDGSKSGDWLRSLTSREELSSFPQPPANSQSEHLGFATHFELRADEELTSNPRWVRLDLRIFPSTSCSSLRLNWNPSPAKPLTFTAAENYFSSSRYNELLGYLEHAVNALTANPNRLLLDIGILSKQEQAAILEKSVGKLAYAKTDVLELLETTCKQFPVHPAVVIGSESLNYTELNDYASRFATYLKDAGVGKGDHVLLSLHTTSWFWVAILGVLKLGAVAIPVFPSPEVLEKNPLLPSDAKAVVCDSATLTASEVFATEERKPIAIDQNWAAIYAKPPIASTEVILPGDTVIIFPANKEDNRESTHFSHASLANVARVLGERLHLRSSDRILQLSEADRIGFYEQLFATIYAGATVVLSDPPPSPAQFGGVLEAAEISVIYCEAETFEQWMTAAKDTVAPLTLRIAALRDQLPSLHALSSWKTYAEDRTELINFWAADSFSTICLEISDRQENTTASICDNSAIYILDGSRIAPDGTEGELVLGGSALALQKQESPSPGKFTFERDSFSPSRDSMRLRCSLRGKRREDSVITAKFPRYTAPAPKAKPAPVKAAVKQVEAKESASAPLSEVTQAEESSQGVHWLRKAEGRTPLFLIHPAKGGLEIYDALLSYLPTDLPCAVLTPALLQNDEDLFVETLANRYVETLLELHPVGSWHVAAYGNGAWIAWEMAQILALQNREFPTLAIIDAIPPRSAGFKGLLQAGLSIGKKKQQNPTVPTEKAEIALNYRAFEGPAKIHVLTQPGEGTRGWKEFAPSAQAHEMKTSGSGLLEEPQVKFVADFLSNRLRRTRPKI